jgi:outer membrane protein TolC
MKRPFKNVRHQLAVTLGTGILVMIAHGQTKPGTLSLLDALESTLREHPQIRIEQEQVGLRRGIEREASGIFDRNYSSGLSQSYMPPALSALTTSTGAVSYPAQNDTSFDFSALRLYHNGITAGPVLDLNRTRDNLVYPNGLSQTVLAYQVTVPLRRNRGTEVVTANLTSAGIQVEGARFDLSQAVSDLLAGTATSYWQLTGALRLLAVAASSEQRGAVFLENVRDLIAADRIPRSEINQVRANLADRTATRIAAEQDVVASRQALALAMGLGPEQMTALTDPTDDFPEASLAALSGSRSETARQYLVLALTRRADYLSAQKRVAAARALIPAAKNQTEPAVDLTFSTGYTGLQKGAAPTSSLASLYAGVNGVNAVGGVRYQSAPANNAAQGRLAQAEVAVRQADLAVTDLARSISASVTVAVDGLRNAAARLQKSTESVAAFRVALDAEREKYRLGFGSLVDILTTEDRLTSALEAQVSAELAYALALAQLRHATGTIVDPDPNNLRTPGRDVFLSPPLLAGAERN